MLRSSCLWRLWGAKLSGPYHPNLERGCQEHASCKNSCKNMEILNWNMFEFWNVQPSCLHSTAPTKSRGTWDISMEHNIFSKTLATFLQVSYILLPFPKWKFYCHALALTRFCALRLQPAQDLLAEATQDTRCLLRFSEAFRIFQSQLIRCLELNMAQWLSLTQFS